MRICSSIVLYRKSDRHTNIDRAVVKALICALNLAAAKGRLGEPELQ